MDPEKRLTIEEVLAHPWLLTEAPAIKLKTAHFINSKDAVATALAAGNRRLRAIELKPVEDAINPILIRIKQRKNSESQSGQNRSNYAEESGEPEILEEVDTEEPVYVLRSALCHLLNLLHMKQDDRWAAKNLGILLKLYFYRL